MVPTTRNLTAPPTPSSVQVFEINHKVWITSCFSFYLARMCIIQNENKPCCPCVSWWIVTPWYLMENVLSIQLSQTKMFYQYFDDWQIKKIKRNRMKWNMFLSFYVILQWYDVTILWYLIWSWLPLVCTRLIQVLSACWIHGLVFGANWYHKSVWRTLMSNTHMDVILWSVCYFGAYCTSYYIALLICPALAMGSKCT